MISNLKYFRKDRSQIVSLGIGESHYMVYEDNKFIEKYFRNEGVIWTYNGKKISIVDKGSRIQAYPNPSLNKLLLIYRESERHPPPSNAVIYNADGSIHKILTPPLLIGRIATKYKKTELLAGRCFGGLYPSWYLDSRGEKVIGVAILFPEGYRNLYGDFFEVREIDLETGEFGEVLLDGAV